MYEPVQPYMNSLLYDETLNKAVKLTSPLKEIPE